jgi:hypothetical protein
MAHCVYGTRLRELQQGKNNRTVVALLNLCQYDKETEGAGMRRARQTALENPEKRKGLQRAISVEGAPFAAARLWSRTVIGGEALVTWHSREIIFIFPSTRALPKLFVAMFAEDRISRMRIGVEIWRWLQVVVPLCAAIETCTMEQDTLAHKSAVS